MIISTLFAELASTYILIRFFSAMSISFALLNFGKDFLMFTLPYRNYCRLTGVENRSPKNGQSTVGMDNIIDALIFILICSNCTHYKSERERVVSNTLSDFEAMINH